ncbi:hypothetical protein EDC04DRAFT_2614945 [Pisolithus marmoratus]|nr:hypothetical protein EDC04DRAFT_2614945 [Pisolithus marmoratus]
MKEISVFVVRVLSWSSVACHLARCACLRYSDHFYTTLISKPGGLYLADPAIAANLCWVRDGRGHVLSYNLHGASGMSEAMTTVSSLLGDNTVNADHSGNSPLSPCVDAAVLCAIVCIDHNDFWLTSDGGYRGPNTIWREILDVKPSCTVLNPGFDPVNSDFAVALQMLQMLMDKCITPGYSSSQSFFSCNNMGPMHFKLCHKLFETLDSAVVDNEEVLLPVTSAMGSLSMVVLGILSLMQELLPDPFSFKLWPLTREKDCLELLALKSTHHILPLPAYDLTGDLIRLSAYQHCLQGALAEVHFTLSHWPIVALKCDVYGAQIQLICLLGPLVGLLGTGKKRKIPLHLDMDETPAKKHISA